MHGHRQLAAKDLPEDSLLRLRPVRHALQDPYFTCTCRPIDGNWHYAGFTDVMSGFNPILHTHFYPADSILQKWLEDPVHQGRELNEGDRLVREVLHMAHDYLHSWAYRAIEHLDPDAGINREPITRDNLDDFAYLHLLTEAAAVVGLDYWFLCVKDMSRRCDLGSLAGPRTVEYQERLLPEYRRFNPALVVQDAAFYSSVVKVFCTDEFDGFGVEDIKRSPALERWLSREVQASYSQRHVTRLWLSGFGGFRLSDKDLHRPLAAPSRKQRRLAEALGNLLWRKIKLGAPLFFPANDTTNPWRYQSDGFADFRIANLTRTPPRAYDWPSFPDPAETFSFYVQQHLSHFRFPADRPASTHDRLRRELLAIKQDFDQSRLQALTSRLTRVDPKQADPAPLEMIFMN